jgi:hypothetical protein
LIEELIVRVLVTDGEVEIRYAIPISPAGEATRFCHLRSDHRGEAAIGQVQANLEDLISRTRVANDAHEAYLVVAPE